MPDKSSNQLAAEKGEAVLQEKSAVVALQRPKPGLEDVEEHRATLCELRKNVEEGKLHVERGREDIQKSKEVLARAERLLKGPTPKA